MKQIYQFDCVVRRTFLCPGPLSYAAVEYFLSLSLVGAT
jgi:hypothetical protein